MGDKSGIEWTDATWNPVVGCSKVSPGCDNCYAITQSERIQRMGGKGAEAYEGTTDDGDWSGLVRTLPERLDQPLKWKRPRRIFVNSMSDLFHPDVPAEFIAKVFAVMALADRHHFQVLTKRPQHMSALLTRRWENLGLESFESHVEHQVGNWDQHYEVQWPLPNVWLGTSIESDKYTFRANHLRATPAAVRFLSLEPLLGPLPSLNLGGIDWVIVGGESGQGARPMHPGWVRDIRDRCVAAGVPFFFKQWGEWAPSHGRSAVQHLLWWDGSHRPDSGPPYTPAGWVNVERVGKHQAGRNLSGRTWDEYPVLVSA